MIDEDEFVISKKTALILIMIIVTVISLTNAVMMEIQYQSNMEKSRMFREMWDNWVFLEPINIGVNQTSWGDLVNQTVDGNLTKR